MFRQLLTGRGEVRRGRLDTRRDLTYVADTVEGFLRAGEVEGIEGDVLQLGTGRAVSIEELFVAARRVVGVEARVVQDAERMRPDRSEVLILLSDPGRAKNVLGWEPGVDLEEGLMRTAAWMAEEPTLLDPGRHHV